jgi:two-component system sensor histidine kinase PilS (NtrC family)
VTIQVLVDVTLLTLVMWSSGGYRSGIPILILIALAGAGLVGEGRMVLFYAAYATVAVLLENIFGTLWGLPTVVLHRRDHLHRLLLRSPRWPGCWPCGLRQRAAGAPARPTWPASCGSTGRSSRTCRTACWWWARTGWCASSTPRGGAAGHRPARGRRWRPTRRPWPGPATAARGTTPATACAPRAAARCCWRASCRPARRGRRWYLEDLDRIHSQVQQVKLAALGRLTASIAHEIRNPLASVSQAAELLREEKRSEMQARLIRIISSNAQRIDNLVGDVLALGRRDEALREVLPLAEFVADFIEEFEVGKADGGQGWW